MPPWSGSDARGRKRARRAMDVQQPRGTLAIDGSIFVEPPARAELAGRGLLPDDPNPVYSLAHGTKDKLLIDGRYYSDKPMIPAVVNTDSAAAASRPNSMMRSNRRGCMSSGGGKREVRGERLGTAGSGSCFSIPTSRFSLEAAFSGLRDRRWHR